MPRQQQLALPLEQVEIPESLLRTAWERSQLKQSFEEAMQLTHLRISLSRVAMSIARKGSKKK
ncbi:MAG TPA: hypothetical protein PLU16_15795 [Gallionellaceae bacterium]|jgi:hypothetical protein|nr:hypothetical protein [Gallionellaceae bacterium]HQS76666.1 hypothetical protein [Gallionellaceae bacterium]